MRKSIPALGLLLVTPIFLAAQTAPTASWKAKVSQSLPLMGHRNWILIVDSAYPLQSNPGIETIETNATQLEVVRYVLDAIGHSIHVRPEVFMDAELPFVPDTDAPGTTAYRTQIAGILRGHAIQSLPHERIIANIDEAGKVFHILVLKTRLTIPYSSVFLRLNCRYWGDASENRLRERMAEAVSRQN
jgi:hypothetical protein